MARGVVDRIEDGVAVVLLEGGGRLTVPARQLPPEARAGTVLSVSWEVEGQADPSEIAALIRALREGDHRA